MAASQNLKVTSPDDCGNAPKKEVIRDVIIAFAKNDLSLVDAFISDEIIYRVVGDKQVEGIDELVLELSKDNSQIVELELTHVITHGKTAAANGIVLTAKGARYEFCHVFTFVSAGKKVIKEITSYVL